MTIAAVDLSKAEARSPKARVLWILFGRRSYWLGQLAAWAGVWLFFCAIFVAAVNDARKTLFFGDESFFCFLGLIATHVLRAIFFFLHWDRLGLVSQWPRLLLVIFLLSAGESCAFISFRTP